MADELVKIPEPPGWPLIHNMLDLDTQFSLGSLLGLAEKYGDIYRLRFPGGHTSLHVCSQALVDEVFDEKRFQKNVSKVLNQVRNGVGDGLFTAYKDEENWGIAHRVLMPAFGPMSIRNMFEGMHDIASQLTLKWARSGPDHRIMVTDDFTRLTLDTLALCSMNYRFNSYYSSEMHPFIEAMGDFLTESGSRPFRLPLPGVAYRGRDAKYQSDIDVMRQTAKGVLEARKISGETHNDLLDAMLKGRDPKTGKKMTDDSIMDNLITFLIAGHETTSGLLSFAFCQLLKHPETYQKAQREVDSVVGTGPITVHHMSKLPYISAVLRETLRLNATIPAIAVEAIEDTVVGGKYSISKGETIFALLAKSHLDPKVFGDDVEEFKPDRMLDEAFEKRNLEFPNNWKPFGNGMRACIGRPFAWQEAILVMAMLLQNFNFAPDPGYVLSLKQTLTVKPKDFYMRAILRDGLTPYALEKRLSGQPVADKASQAKEAAAATTGEKGEDGPGGKPITILYGSNSGTCEALAQRIASDAPSHGFPSPKVDTLDSAQGRLPTDRPVVIVTASYEGEPPDNAAQFVAWLQGAAADSLKDVSYAVFGCGNKEWTQTFHRVPKMVDAQMEKLGATRSVEIGLADAGSSDVWSDFETWEDNKLWPSLKKQFSVGDDDSSNKEPRKASAGMNVKISTPRSQTLRQDVKPATVVEARTLTSADATDAKRHLEISLPEGMKYKAGDYLAVLPINPPASVRRAMRRFGLAVDAHLEITTTASGTTTLPVDRSVPASDVLGSYVELSQPATKRNINILAEYAGNEATKTELLSLAEDKFEAEVRDKRLSVLDALERFPDIELPIAVFLSMMPPMRIRQYSISSSPLWNPGHVTISFSVLNAPALSGIGAHVGVATSYLESLSKGDTLHVATRPSHSAFSAPPDPETTPVIYIAAGSGLAPFRGFIQERAEMISGGGRPKLAPALLFFGCRSPDQDDLYREEMDAWEAAGAVEVVRAYSRAPEQSGGCAHVDDAVWANRERCSELWQQGAKVYVCGSKGVGQAAQEAVLKIGSENGDSERVKEWFDGLRNTRYVTDIFD